MTARSEMSRIFEIKSGPIDVRIDTATSRLCLVFEAAEMDVRLFRTMTLAEAKAFRDFLDKRIGEAS